MKIKNRLLAITLAALTSFGSVAYAATSYIKANAMEIGGSIDLDNDSEGTIVFQADISKAIITLTDGDSYVHTGSEICPKFTVRRTPNAVKDLVEGTQYTVKYHDNINPGTATIEITGIGQFKGTATKTFSITHDYSATEVVAPTHTTQGYTIHKCSACDDYYIDSYVPKLNMSIKYQTKDINDDTYAIRALLVVDDEDATIVDSASAYLDLGDYGKTDKVTITKAYKSVIAAGKTVTAGQGKVFLIAKFMGIPKDCDSITASFNCGGIVTNRILK